MYRVSSIIFHKVTFKDIADFLSCAFYYVLFNLILSPISASSERLAIIAPVSSAQSFHPNKK
jgi:hypothetical protein